MLWMLVIIDRDPRVSRSQPVTLAIVMRERMVVLHAILKHEFRTFLATFPPWGYYAPRRFPTKIFEQPVAFVHDGSLLLQIHSGRILMGVAVKSNFMTSISDHCAFCWEGLERVSRNEPGRLDVILLEQLQ